MSDSESTGAKSTEELPNTPSSINEFAVAHDLGFTRVEGPFEVSKAGTVWTVIIPEDDIPPTPLTGHEGDGAVLVADGEVIGGGILEEVWAPEGEGELHVQIDQYAGGDA